MRHALTMLLIVILVGCTSTREYDDGIGKRPIRLTLERDGSYYLRQTGTTPYTLEEERGLWYQVTDEVVALVANDKDKQERFARTSEERSILGNLRLYTRLRSAINTPLPPALLP